MKETPENRTPLSRRRWNLGRTTWIQSPTERAYVRIWSPATDSQQRDSEGLDPYTTQSGQRAYFLPQTSGMAFISAIDCGVTESLFTFICSQQVPHGMTTGSNSVPPKSVSEKTGRTVFSIVGIKYLQLRRDITNARIDKTQLFKKNLCGVPFGGEKESS